MTGFLRIKHIGRKFALSIFVSTLIFPPSLVSAADIPLVAAAASLNHVLEEIAEHFVEATGQEVKLVFGSSGNLARQIMQGAPFELFLSADEDYVDLLKRGDKTRGQGAVYAEGRVVLFVPGGSQVSIDADLTDIKAAILDGRLQHLAIANPDQAPYGRAAKEILQKKGLWQEIKSQLVIGENAGQAMQFAISGSVQAGIVPYSLVMVSAVSKRGSYVLLNKADHAPLRQRMVLLRSAGNTAENFYAFLQTPWSRKIFERYGFVVSAVQARLTYHRFLFV